MNHSECVKKLKEIGKIYGFYTNDGIKLGKMYHMGNPDCVWYLECKGKEPLMKITRGDICKQKSCKYIEKHGRGRYFPIVAFEVPNSENEKALRGSLMTLQFANASASVIVLIGKSAEKHTQYTNKLVGRYSSIRLRIWPEKYVNSLYDRIMRTKKTKIKI
ncbi:MAG: hypothetical protein Q8N56_01470 [bacterium]|nr:hypothetical protein [bacterium]